MSDPDKSFSVQRIIVGTHTSDQEQNYLMVAKVRLPVDAFQSDRKFDDDRGECGSFGNVSEKVEVYQKINHDGEVNRARYQPKNPDIVATKAVSGDVNVFDLTKHPSDPAPGGKCTPDIVLKGHSQEGYGLSWNPNRPSHLLSSSDDGTVCMWDVQSATKQQRTLQPLQTYAAHTSNAEDVAWHRHNESFFASVGDDKRLLLWDIRAPADAPAMQVEAHSQEVNCVSFSPYAEFPLVTGGTDNLVKLWDMRSLKSSLHDFVGHTDGVYRCEWSPSEETVIASAGNDRRVNMWDISRIGNEQTAEDAEDGPPELLFIHGGHTSKVNDFSWNPNENWVMASVAEDNILQVWLPSSSVYTEPGAEPDSMAVE